MKKHLDSILDVTAIVLANLCVAFIMTSQNEEAEELMRRIEREEEQVAYENADRQCIHLCIVNLVIGTLYCAKVRGVKGGGVPACSSCSWLSVCCLVCGCVCVDVQGNFEFGISRIMKSLEPYDKKLGTDTWYYAKRCFLGLAENLAKHMLLLKVRERGGW